MNGYQGDEIMKQITLHTKNTTYQIGVHRLGFLLHLYYGARTECDMSYLLQEYDRGFSGNPHDAGGDRSLSLDVLPQEFPCYGTGDFRSAAFNVRNVEGVHGVDLRYAGHQVRRGKYALPGLPAVYEEEEALKRERELLRRRAAQRSEVRSGHLQETGQAAQAEEELCSGEQGAYTLEVTLADRNVGVEVILLYGVLPELDVITRSAVVRNSGKEDLYISKVFGCTLDFLRGDYDLLHFHGRHTMERKVERVPVMHGKQSFGSRRGTSSHQHNPFAILAERETTEDHGDCYGMAFLYSGNFSFEAEQDQYRQVRMQMGMLDEMMDYPLTAGECLYVPETAMAYTKNGLSALSHIYHKMIREHVCRGPYKTARRPVLINNWEATYFHFTGEKILKIAKQAAQLGVEMLVLDDGWFGKRDDDNSGLGDWSVNEKKLGMPLAELAEKMNDMGMQFGLWIEPEMVNEDSELYRRHPDWAFQIPGRQPCRCRNQLALDFSRKEVVDHIFEQIASVLDRVNVSYIKMDMNRSLSDIYTQAAEKYQNYAKTMHGYVLGVYDFLERLIARYPHILIEGCSGGGGRFDAGMLFYTPQIWCSDDTDAIERIRIQHGTSFAYPISTVGSHVSAVPNHQTGRTTKLFTRSVVAMAGSFGYELDLNLISEEEKAEVKEQIADDKKYWHLIHNGRYYRLHDPEQDREAAAWSFVAEDGEEMLLNVVALDAHGNAPIRYIRCKGLDPDARYRCVEEKRAVKPYHGSEPRRDVKQLEGRIYDGAALMCAGVPIPMELGEYEAMQVHFKRVEAEE